MAFAPPFHMQAQVARSWLSMQPTWLLLIAALLLAMALPRAAACTSLLVGRGASADGSLLLARSDDGSDAIRCGAAREGVKLVSMQCSGSGKRLGRSWRDPPSRRLLAYGVEQGHSPPYFAGTSAQQPPGLPHSPPAAENAGPRALHSHPPLPQRHQQPGLPPCPSGARHLALQHELPAGEDAFCALTVRAC